MANMSEMIGVNQAAMRARKEKLQLHHVEIHPERDKRGKAVKGGGHTVHTVHSRDGDDWGTRHAEKPFGAGEHEEMLAHVANELKLPEPAEDGEEQEEAGDGEEATGAAH